MWRGFVAVHREHPQHVLAVLLEAGERTHAGRGAGRRGVAGARQERGERGGPGATGVAVVGQALAMSSAPRLA